ncbi:MAG TPA: hypothetical protein VF556_02945 [Pyrinomonadaceae bacterium]|jgi:hypothetical protein
MKITSLLLCLTLLIVSAPFAFAADTSYEVEMLVTKGDDTKEENSRIVFTDNSFKVVSKKGGSTLKEINYADIKAAEYSFSKKPMWKTGAVAALALGVLALPIFFMKSKSHWLTVRSDKDFAVLKLEKDNYRQIQSEFETHSVKVETIKEEENKKDKDSPKDKSE